MRQRQELWTVQWRQICSRWKMFAESCYRWRSDGQSDYVNMVYYIVQNAVFELYWRSALKDNVLDVGNVQTFNYKGKIAKNIWEVWIVGGYRCLYKNLVAMILKNFWTYPFCFIKMRWIVIDAYLRSCVRLGKMFVCRRENFVVGALHLSVLPLLERRPPVTRVRLWETSKTEFADCRLSWWENEEGFVPPQRDRERFDANLLNSWTTYVFSKLLCSASPVLILYSLMLYNIDADLENCVMGWIADVQDFYTHRRRILFNCYGHIGLYGRSIKKECIMFIPVYQQNSRWTGMIHVHPLFV